MSDGGSEQAPGVPQLGNLSRKTALPQKGLLSDYRNPNAPGAPFLGGLQPIRQNLKEPRQQGLISKEDWGDDSGTRHEAISNDQTEQVHTPPHLPSHIPGPGKGLVQTYGPAGENDHASMVARITREEDLPNLNQVQVPGQQKDK